VRDFTSVHDVVEAYGLLLEHGEPGEVYNIASGKGTSLRDVFFLIADAVGTRIIPEVDSAFIRSADIPYLVGNATKLRRLTGWKPSVSLEATIKEVVDACA
jgi:GDP-4-dehydro-6-deoxy-D-mannose reductase